ncbi:aspartate aminotransferase-like enzyme [Paraburkholderia sp. JPY419]
MTARHPFLLTPGPLALAAEVKAEMQFDMGSRDVSFKKITERVRGLIVDLLDARGGVLGSTHTGRRVLRRRGGIGFVRWDIRPAARMH